MAWGKNTPSCDPLISSTSLYLLTVVRMSTVNILQSPMHFLSKHTSMQQSHRPSEGCWPQQRAQNWFFFFFFFSQVFFQGFWIHSCIDIRVMKAYKLNAFETVVPSSPNAPFTNNTHTHTHTHTHTPTHTPGR